MHPCSRQSTAGGDFFSTHRAIENAAEEFVQLREVLENRFLRAEAQNLLDASKKNPPLPSIAANMDALLITPLLSAPLRAELLEARDKIEPSLSSGGEADAQPGVTAGRLAQDQGRDQWHDHHR